MLHGECVALGTIAAAYISFLRENITKDVVYFLGELSAGTPMPQEGELEEIYLLPYEEAYEKLQFERSKEVLTLADKFLRGKR